MKDSQLYMDIVNTYKETKSVARTADIVGTNTLRVRRVLITEGLWSSKTSKSIGELHSQGLSVAEIAEYLVMSEKNVQSYMPYTKGMYADDEKSEDSIRSKRYRNRKNLNSDFHLDIPQTELFISNESSEVTDYNGNKPCAIKIHLELNTDRLTPNEMDELKQFASAKKAISRDVIVPADISLHALHYVIQSVFNWENAHSHHYSFPKDTFEKITRNKVSRWLSLCGIYFRYPSDTDDDKYWDDDYFGETSFKKWLKNKYTGPYIYCGSGDYYLENQEKVAKLKNDLPLLKVLPSLDDYKAGIAETDPPTLIPLTEAPLDIFARSIYLGGEINQLLERLTLLDYLFLPDGNTNFIESLDNRIRFLEQDLDSLLEHWSYLKDDVKDNADSIYLIAQLSTTRMQAQCTQLEYYYDYSDEWQVAITCTDVYYDDSISSDKTVRKVVDSHAPVCVAADGLSVVDEIGGVFGYLDFLKSVFGKKPTRKTEDLLMWAKEKGWSEKLESPKKLL